jgi:hypothetical protein
MSNQYGTGFNNTESPVRVRHLPIPNSSLWEN